MTDPLGQSQVLPYIQGLTKMGYHFTILSFEKKDRFKKEGELIHSITTNSNIAWHPLFFTASPPVIAKIYDRYQMQKHAFLLYRKKKFVLIHCRSYVAAETGLKLKRKFGVRMLFDMRGFWADEKKDNGQWNMKSLLFRNIYKHFKKKENEFLLLSDGIISLTHAAKEYLHKQSDYKNLPITVIPCCADLALFNYLTIDSQDKRKIRESLGISENAKVITYLGSVGGWYMTKEMFSFFKLILDRYPDYKMLVLTKDDEKKVRREAASTGIPSTSIIVTYSERNQLPLYLSICSLSIFFIRNSFSKIASSPTKHAELMGMGIPVICNNIGDTGWIIDDTKTGYIVDAFDDKRMKEAVNGLAEIEFIDKKMIRKNAITHFDLKSGIIKYGEVYNNMLLKPAKDE